MLGFRLPHLSPPRVPATSPRSTPLHIQSSSHPFIKTQFQISKAPTKFVSLAQNGDDLIKEPGDKAKQNGDGVDFDMKKDSRAALNFKWSDLLDPDPDNIFAIALTGLLAWASVQVLWQLAFVSIAILVAALKYTFIAAFLLFILITLL